MATETSREWVVSVRLCIACGRYHGPVNAEINCLRAKVTELRARLAVEGVTGPAVEPKT
jgi:hypothetical protein